MTATPVRPIGPGGKGRLARHLANPRDAWPRWAQEDRWTIDEDADAPAETGEPPAGPEDDGPSDEDARWAAEHLNDGADWHDADGADWHDAEGPEPDWDALAEDAALMDRLEAGYLPC